MKKRTHTNDQQTLRFIRSEWRDREPVKLDFFPFETFGVDYFTRLDSCDCDSREFTEDDCDAFMPKHGGIKVSGQNWMGYWYAGEFIQLGTQIYDDNGVERTAYIFEFWLNGSIQDQHMYLATWTNRPEDVARKITSYQSDSN